MEEKGLVKRSSLENIAEAIRTQLGTDEQFTPDNMDEAILRIQSGGGGSGTEDIFWVTYGTTTSAEIQEAYQAGKMCFCKVDTGTVLQLFYPATATYHVFTGAYDSTIYIAICNNSSWSKVTRQLAKASDVVAADQGVANAGKFMVVGSDGVVAPVAMSAWQGGAY